MSKLCTATFEKVSISAVQDLLAVKADAAKPIRIKRYWIFCVDSALPASSMLALKAKTTTSLTFGSGGSSQTPVHLDPTNSTTISATAHKNDTTQSTSTFVSIEPCGGHIYTGYDSAWSNRDPIDIPAGGGFVFELSTALGAAALFSGGIDFEEVG